MKNVRNPFLLFLLLLLLVIAQHGAVTHKFSHYNQDILALKHHDNKQYPDDRLCKQCVAFDQIDSVVNASPLFLFQSLNKYPYTQSLFVAFLTVAPSTSRCRDPPAFL